MTLEVATTCHLLITILQTIDVTGQRDCHYYEPMQYLNGQGHSENLAKIHVNDHNSILRFWISIIFNTIVVHDPCASLVINQRSYLHGQGHIAVVAKTHVRSITPYGDVGSTIVDHDLRVCRELDAGS